MDQIASDAPVRTGHLRGEEEYARVISRSYKGWLLDQVTRWVGHSRTVLGHVIAHSPSRAERSEASAKEPHRTRDDPYRPSDVVARPELRRGETLEEGRARVRQERAEVLAEVRDRA